MLASQQVGLEINRQLSSAVSVTDQYTILSTVDQSTSCPVITWHACCSKSLFINRK